MGSLHHLTFFQPLVNDKLRAPDIAAGNTPDEPELDSNPLIAPEQMNECGNLQL